MEYIKFVNEWCERTISHLENEPTLDMVTGNVHGLVLAKKKWKSDLWFLFGELKQKTMLEDNELIGDGEEEPVFSIPYDANWYNTSDSR